MENKVNGLLNECQFFPKCEYIQEEVVSVVKYITH